MWVIFFAWCINKHYQKFRIYEYNINKNMICTVFFHHLHNDLQIFVIKYIFEHNTIFEFIKADCRQNRKKKCFVQILPINIAVGCIEDVHIQFNKSYLSSKFCSGVISGSINVKNPILLVPWSTVQFCGKQSTWFDLHDFCVTFFYFFYCICLIFFQVEGKSK